MNYGEPEVGLNGLASAVKSEYNRIVESLSPGIEFNTPEDMVIKISLGVIALCLIITTACCVYKCCCTKMGNDVESSPSDRELSVMRVPKNSNHIIQEQL